MSKDWSLNEIYESFQDKKFLSDMSSFVKLIDEFNFWCDNNLKNQSDLKFKLETYIDFENKIGAFTKIFDYAELTLSTDSNNNYAIKALDTFKELEIKLVKPRVIFKTFLKNIDDLDLVISKSSILKENEFFLNETKSISNYMLSKKEEIAISTLRLSGSNLWEKLREQLTSDLVVDINIMGEQKQVPISNIRNFAYVSDANLRKNAYENELLAYKKIDKSIAFALNGIKGEVISISKLRGYSSVLELTLLSSRMEMKTLETMQNCIKKYLPYFHKYFKHKAYLLGHNDGLPFYDLFAPIGELDITFTYEEAQEYVIKNFNSFDKKLGDFAKQAFDNNWIDVEPKIGKRGGAFSHNIHPINESRILLNFTGSFSDVITLAHELGHAYHDKCVNTNSFTNAFYPMPIAETASTFCETLIIKSALDNCTKQEKLIILENDISGSAQIIVDIYSRFLFEDEVIKQRVKGSLSVHELNQIMINAQKEAYGDSLDENYLHEYMWLCKPHYYSADFNYYNFPYSFGLLFSKGLYAKYQHEKNGFHDKYIKLLNATGYNDLITIAKMMDIDLNSEEFWISSLEIIKNEIDEFIKIK